MNRIPIPRRTSVARNAVTDESSDGGGRSGLRTVLLGVVVAAVAYVVARRVRSSGRAPSTEAVRETVDDVRSGGGLEIPIGERGEESDDETAESDDAEADDEEGRPDASDDDLPGQDLSPEEIEERAEEDVREEPAPPGEMTVDEDVVDDVIDEEEAGEDDENE